MSPISPTRTIPWPPADTFIPVDSKVAGITVLAPSPARQQETAPAAVFKCPRCGAATRFDISAGGVACEHCGYQAVNKPEILGKRAEEYEFTVATWDKATQGWGIERQELHCDSCGATITLAETTLSITCPFCASNEVHTRLSPEDNLRPRFLIPFKIQMDTVRARTQEWLGKGWFHPADLRSQVGLDRFTGIYLPFWTFDSQITADWNAEVGHERQERYYDGGDKTWKTRTVIDWRWEHGQVGVSIDDLLLAGSTRVSRLLINRLYPFDLKQLIEYRPEYLAGWQAQAFDITLTTAWEEAKAQMREQGRQACYQDIPSSHVRNFSMSADFADETWRYILLPVYIAAYRFENKTYQVLVNGQSGAVAGQKPVAWWKIWLVIAALLAPGIILGLVGLPLTALGGSGLPLIFLGFILLVIGGGISAYIYRQAVASEAS